ncbi:MAG: hypothetical protein ABIF08_04560 [Nanoarchaeota archaeon]
MKAQSDISPWVLFRFLVAILAIFSLIIIIDSLAFSLQGASWTQLKTELGDIRDKFSFGNAATQKPVTITSIVAKVAFVNRDEISYIIDDADLNKELNCPDADMFIIAFPCIEDFSLPDIGNPEKVQAYIKQTAGVKRPLCYGLQLKKCQNQYINQPPVCTSYFVYDTDNIPEINGDCETRSPTEVTVTLNPLVTDTGEKQYPYCIIMTSDDGSVDYDSCSGYTMT